MSVAFLITSPYQVFHYKWIAAHLPETTAVIEVREREYGVAEDFLEQHMPHSARQWVSNGQLGTLDGRFEAVVCQTPILPLEFLDRTKVVAQQYSLAKEQYQYGVWRAHAHLNLMYGRYSVDKVSGFSNAVASGNPLLDPYFSLSSTNAVAGAGQGRRRLLYMPTYGQLSSLRSVLPRLRDIDADVTLKLHHADVADLPAKRPADLQIVYSDADPVELFRTHDAVISDVSGAAYDALYAGLPVILASTSYDREGDYHRLSSADRDFSLLSRVASVWDISGDFFEALAAAERLKNTPDRRDFLERTFVNAGSAGAACAEEVRRLLEEGEPEHFGAQQVRGSTRRYITTGRRRRNLFVDEETGDLRVDHQLPPIRQSRFAEIRLALRRIRGLLAKSDTLRRTVHTLRRRVRASEIRPDEIPGRPLPPAPGSRREAIFRDLLPYLMAEGVASVRDSEEPGADAAVLVDAKRGLYRALRQLAERRDDFKVRIGTDWRITETIELKKLRTFDLFNAHWLELGSIRERGTYRIGVDGYLTILLVEHESSKGRLLALKKRAGRTDWTELFATVDPHRPSSAPTTGTRSTHPASPVDVVYTWVDSNDEAWQDAHARYSQEHGEAIPSANNEERYLDREELRYSLRSLWMFAPFVRHIYIVTANQRPWWLEDNERVTVIPHSEIFPDASVLPTFNSHAIEACLHRIPGLSEHFLYLNDDVFLGREVTEADFFTMAGLAKVRLSPSQYIYQGRPESHAIPTDWAAYNVVSLLQRDFGLAFDRRVQHVPLVQRRSALEEIEKRYPDEVARTRASRFRSAEDVAIPSMLGQFYSIATGRAVEWPNVRNEYVYLDTGRRDVFDRFEQILKVRPRFFCLNATRYDEIGLAAQARHLRDFLVPAFPCPAPWEREASGS